MLARTFGSARFAYKQALRVRATASAAPSKYRDDADASTVLTARMRAPTTARLNEVSSVPTQQVLRPLDRTFRNVFVGRAEVLSCDKQQHHHSVEYTASAFRWAVDTATLTLAWMEAPLASRRSRPNGARPNGARPNTVTVGRDSAGRSFDSMLVVEEVVIAPQLPCAGQVGLDRGPHDAVVLDSGETVGTPAFFRREERCLAKAPARMACVHATIGERRGDFLYHRATRYRSTHTIRENPTVCVESPRGRAMVRNPTLATAIHDVGWGQVVRRLAYKAAWYARTRVVVLRWHPSSKRGFTCGHVRASLSLAPRRWTCLACGVVHDRDVNAAKNVKAAGIAVSAGGGAVGPGAGSPVVGGPR